MHFTLFSLRCFDRVFFFFISSRKERKNPPPQKAADLLFCSFVTPKKTVVQTFFFSLVLYQARRTRCTLPTLSRPDAFLRVLTACVVCCFNWVSLVLLQFYVQRIFGNVFFFFFLTLFIFILFSVRVISTRCVKFCQKLWFQRPQPSKRLWLSVSRECQAFVYVDCIFSSVSSVWLSQIWVHLLCKFFFFCIFLLAFLPTCILFCFSSVSKIAPFTRERGAFLRFAWKIETSWVNAGILANSVINGLVPFEYFDAFFGNWNFVWPLF